MISFKAHKKDLRQTLKSLRAGLRGKSAKALNTICEITITDGKVSFVVPGSEFFLTCETQGGAAKATLPFLYFAQVVKDLHDGQSVFQISDGEILIGPLAIKAITCFFKDDKILRSIYLPINYTDADILRLRNGKYTLEELDFNKMFAKIENAEERMNMKIANAHRELKVYGVQFDELEKLVKEKLAK